MRLTIINQFYRPDVSPTAHLSASLAEDRAARGDNVTVITSRGGYVGGDRATSQTSNAGRGSRKPNVIRVWTPRLGKATHLKRLIDYGTFYLMAAWHMLTLPRQDVIVSLTTPPYIAWTAALHKAFRRRTKLVLWNMDCYPDVVERAGIIRKNGAVSRVLRLLNRSLYRQADHLVCLDTAMVELLMSQYAPSRQKPPTTIIPNWEDAAFFPADAKPPTWTEASSLGLDGAFVVVYLGNTGVGHAFETALDAADMLRDTNVKFLFVGGGSRWKQIEAVQKERNLSNVILRGYVPKEQTPAVMGAAHMALITLRDDALGVMSPSKLHANLAMGLPIAYVGPKGSNVDDAIDHFSCGVSIRHGDATGLANAIRKIATDPARLAELRTRSRHAFDSAYCDLRTLPQFETVLTSLAGRD